MKTFVAKKEEVTRNWYVVDATDKPTGRLAVAISNVLRGKTKPTYTPNVDTGDFVVVINADKVKLTGNKEDKKIYQDFSGYPDGLKEMTARTVRAKDPTRIITQAVRGMLPKNRLSRCTFKRLKVYAGADHPHDAQNPQALELKI
ncbi:MAG: 50S ribosomal protein L13 [Spartobacteria bacterium]|nr:50S ribosomal protein L13 [Spartobacteria bacterium]